MIGFALVGCGRIAMRHAELLGGGLVRDAKLVAVCDVVADRARAFGEKYAVPHFEDMHAMMAQVANQIQAVCILTESGLHAQHAVALAPYRKHLVVEKPMALTLEDARAMIDSCDHNGIRLFVVKQNRFNVPVRKLRSALEQGRFGKLVLGTVRVRWCRRQEYYDQAAWRGTWKYDGGVISNQASHHVDLLCWMMGEVESVFAKGARTLARIEAEDTAVVTVKFRNGGLGLIEATTATRPSDLEGSISILGEHGTVVISGFAVNRMETWSFETHAAGDDEVLENYSVNPPSVYGFSHKEYLENVVDSIGSGAPALVEGLEGLKSLEVITAIYESMETGREVFLRFQPKHCRLGLL